MKTIRHHVGTIVLILWVLGLLGFIDFHLCVGPSGSCKAPAASAKTA